MYGTSIVVVGGKNSQKCEAFNISNDKWKTLSDLPHERMGCSLLSDENSDYLYLFGGYCSKQDKYMENVLRLNMARSFDWEVITVKQNSELLARSNSACAKIANGYISILGGKSELCDKTDLIIDFDIAKKKVEENSKRLTVPCVFKMTNFVDLNNKDFFFMDGNCYIHKISNSDFNVMGAVANSFIFNTFTDN